MKFQGFMDCRKFIYGTLDESTRFIRECLRKHNQESVIVPVHLQFVSSPKKIQLKKCITFVLAFKLLPLSSICSSIPCLGGYPLPWETACSS